MKSEYVRLNQLGDFGTVKTSGELDYIIYRCALLFIESTMVPKGAYYSPETF